MSRAEQSRAEQSRAEQSRAEQSRAEQSRAEQGLRANLDYNNGVKANTAFYDELKNKLPNFFTADKLDEFGAVKELGSFDLEKFKSYLVEKNINELSSGYQLDFIGKNYAKKQAGERSTTVIVPDNVHNEKAENKSSKNLFFSGDNLEVLRHLQQNYANSIDFIYIDPPYNTGSDGFVYPDKFEYSDEQLQDMFGLNDDELKRLKSIQGKSTHSAWLTFMYPRLYLAKKLLKDTGVIFVSIDDNEQANLKLLMDDIFGEGSFINSFAWISNLTGRQISGTGAAKTYETIFAYAKNINDIDSFNVDIAFAKNKMPNAYKGFDKKVLIDELGEYTIGDTLWNHNRIFNEATRPNLVFSIFYNKLTGQIKSGDINEKFNGYKEILPHKNQDGSHKYHAWRWSRKKVDSEGDNLIVKQTSKGLEIYTKIRDFKKTLLKDLITNISNGDTELAKLFNQSKLFNYPKSSDLVKLLINSIDNKELTVFDFFAGSSTTGDAVMQLNAEDGGHRQFIMCTLPEPTFTTNADGKEVPTKGGEAAYKAGFKSIDEISRERIIRSSAKIKAENANLSEDFDGGFKHYRVVPAKQETLDQLEFGDNLQLDMFDNMLDNFSSDYLGVAGQASGFDTVLQTYLATDNYRFDVSMEMLNFNGVEVAYVNQQRIYIITDNWQSGNTKALVNKIGTNQIVVQTIVVFGYTISIESLKELKIALNQLENSVRVLVRY